MQFNLSAVAANAPTCNTSVRAGYQILSIAPAPVIRLGSIMVYSVQQEKCVHWYRFGSTGSAAESILALTSQTGWERTSREESEFRRPKQPDEG